MRGTSRMAGAPAWPGRTFFLGLAWLLALGWAGARPESAPVPAARAADDADADKDDGEFNFTWNNDGDDGDDEEEEGDGKAAAAGKAKGADGKDAAKDPAAKAAKPERSAKENKKTTRAADRPAAKKSGDDDDDDDDDGKDEPPPPRETRRSRRYYGGNIEGLMENFEIDQRYFKNPRKDFFAKAAGGGDLKKFYGIRKTSRHEVHKHYPEEDTDYYKEIPRLRALVWVPKAFEADKGEGWGILLRIGGSDGESFLRNNYETLQKHKLVYAAIKGRDLPDTDIRAMTMLLDLLASLRKSHPALAGAANKKRTFLVGENDDGARLAGVLAANFSNEFRGLIYIDGAAVRDGLPRRRGRGALGNYRRRFRDFNYFSASDFKKMGRRVRLVVFCTRGNRSYYREFLTYVALDYKKAGFALRFYPDLDDDDSRPDDEMFSRALDFLDGDNSVEQPPVHTPPDYDFKWD